MGGRGNKFGGQNGASNAALEKSIERANMPIDERKAGASYRNIQPHERYLIKTNLRFDDETAELFRTQRGVISHELQMRAEGQKGKLYVTMAPDGRGGIDYTIKHSNKILLRTKNKNRAANKIAQFIIDGRKKKK